MMRKYGVNRQVISKDELLKIEPAFTSFAHQIVGGTITPSDESGDCRVFTQELAKLCAARGADFLVRAQRGGLECGGWRYQIRSCSRTIDGG